jgi:tRNA-2-methylthio-N6-dimethylallyladenosine synthase
MALQALQADIQRALYQASVGSTVEVLVDSTSRRRAWELAGRTSGNTVVNFPGPREWFGQVVPVRITGAGPNSLRGEPARASAPVEAGHAD